MSSFQYLLFATTVLSLATLSAGTTTRDECTAKDETIYHADADNVVPPVFIRDEGPDDIRGSARLELLINAQGKICSIQFFERVDREWAKKLGEHIVLYWKFKPATREGKPVAAFFPMNFPPVRPKNR